MSLLRPWRWWSHRWFRRTVLTLALLTVVVRLALPSLVGWALRLVGESQGMQVSLEEADFALLRGMVTLRHLEARAEQGLPTDPPLLHAEYVHLDLDLSALLRGDLRVHRMEVDGLDARLRRRADGTLEWPIASPDGAAAADAVGAEPAAAAAPDRAAAPVPITFDLPFQADSVRLDHLALHWEDQSVAPPVQVDLTGSVRLSNLGSEDRPLQLVVTFHDPKMLDHLGVEVRGQMSGRHLDLTSKVTVKGLRPGPIAGLLAPLGVTPRSERLDLSFQARTVMAPNGPEDPRSAAVLAAGPFWLREDGAEALALDQLEVQIAALDTHLVQAPRVAMQGLRAAVRRQPDGSWLAAGLEYAPDRGGQDGTEAPRAPDPGTSSEPFVLELGQLELGGVQLVLDDASTAEPVHLEIGLLAMLTDLVLDPTRPEAEATLGAMIQIADAADLQVQARAAPFAARRTIEASVDGSGLTLAALGPYLAQAGLESTLEDGRLTLHLTATAESREEGLFADLELSRLSLEDASLERPFELGRMIVQGIALTEEALRVQEVSLAGTRVDLSQESDGLELPGLRTRAPTSQGAARGTSGPKPETTGSAPSDAVTPPLPRMELGRLSWSDTSLRFADRRTAVPSAIALEGWNLQVTDLALGGDPERHGPATALLEWSASVEDLARHLELKGSVTSQPGRMQFDAGLGLRAEGVVFTALAPMLEAAGLQACLGDGSLQADLQAHVEQNGEQWEGDAVVSALSWKDGTEEHVALDELRVTSFAFGPRALSLGEIQVTGPRLALQRTAEGALEMAGLRLPPPAPAAVETAAPPAGVPPEPGAAAPTPPSKPSDAPPSPALLLDHLVLTDGLLRWRDAAVEPAVDASLRWNVDVTELGVGVAERTATLQLRAEVEGALERLSLAGTAHLPPDGVHAELALDLDGLRAGPFAVYLPEGFEPAMEHGTLHASLVADQRPVAAGGSSLQVAVEDVDYRERGREEPWFAWRRLNLDIPRSDPVAGVHEIADLSLEGLRLDVRRTADRSLLALGLRLRPSPAEAAEAESDQASDLPEEPTEEPALPAPTTPDADPAAGPSLRAVLPRVTLGKVDLGVERLFFLDESAEHSTPLEASLRLTHAGTTVVCQAEAEELTPVEFEVRGRFAPVLESLVATIQAAPFALDPSLDVSLRGDGLRGAGLTEVLPALAEVLDGSGLDGGRFQTDLEVLAHVRRRGPLQLDWSRGIGLDVDLKDLRLQATPEGPVLIGLEDLHAEVTRLDQAGNVHLRRLEVLTPRARIRRSAEGLHLAGLLFRNPPPAADPAAGGPAPATEEPPAAADPSTEPPSDPGPEFRVDELLVSGIAVDYRDESVTPVSHLPLMDLELLVKGFTTRAFQENRSVKFQLLVNGGSTEFPKRVDSASALTGFLAATAKKLVGRSDQHQTEQRPFLDQLQASGSLAFHPHLEGNVRADLRGLELLSIAGQAAASGVQIGDGVINSRVDLRFRKDGGLTTSSDLRFTDLALSEAPGGPISTYLKLPAPLDVVLYVLKDEKDEHRLKVDFSVPPGGVSWTEVSRIASLTLATQIANAISAAPLRVTSSLTDLIGLDFSRAPALPDGDRVLEFAPGTPTVSGASTRALRDWAATVRQHPSARVVVTQVLAPADVELLVALANPDPADCRALSARLRQRRDRLLRERTEQVAEAMAHFSVGRREEAALSVGVLQELDRQIAATESSMDRLHALLRPGAERRADRRTREAGRELGQQRLDHALGILRELGIAASRVDARRARFVVDEDRTQGAVFLVPRVPEGQ